MTVLVIRIVAIVAGAAIFLGAELLDNHHATKPFATGKQQADTFFDDAKVLSLRLAGIGLVVIALVSWVIGNHMPAR